MACGCGRKKKTARQVRLAKRSARLAAQRKKEKEIKQKE